MLGPQTVLLTGGSKCRVSPGLLGSPTWNPSAHCVQVEAVSGNEHGSSWAALGTCVGQLSHSPKLHLHPCSVESGMQ